MKALAGIALGVSAFGLAAGANAQTANFACPKSPMSVEYSDGSKATFTGRNGPDFCHVIFTDKAGVQNTYRAYAPSLAVREDRSQSIASQLKASSWWPLQVGKKIDARFDGTNPDGFDGTWYEKISIDKYESVTTPAGTFEAFLVTRREENARGYKSTSRNWWAPSLGMTVKSEYSDNQGRNINRHVTKITQ